MKLNLYRYVNNLRKIQSIKALYKNYYTDKQLIA